MQDQLKVEQRESRLHIMQKKNMMGVNKGSCLLGVHRRMIPEGQFLRNRLQVAELIIPLVIQEGSLI